MTTTSYHLRSTSELMLVANIKQGFVQNDERLVSYSTRLGLLLDMLFEGRRVATEVRLLPGSGPIERLDTIFGTQWAIRQRPQRAELIVSAVFDSSWEAYLRNLQQNTGQLLDAIFCHCEGYDGHTCVVDGYERFSRWLRDHQVQTRFFHAATPDLTVPDLRGLRRIATAELDTRTAIASVEQTEASIRNTWPPPDQQTGARQAIEREQVLNSMLGLRDLFSEHVEVSRRNERDTYLAAIQSLLESSLDVSLQERARQKKLLPFQPRPVAPVALAADPNEPLAEPTPDAIQYNILRAHNDGLPWEKKLKHGLLVMLQADHAEAMRGLLRKVVPEMASDAWATDRPEGLEVNVAMTHAGLTRFGLSEDVLGRMPREFQVGMANRAGLLGDVGPQAHPSSWEQVRCNWPEDSPQVVSLSNVDVVLLVQKAVPERDNDHQFSPNHPLYKELKALELDIAGSGVHILHVQALRRYDSDHFRLGEETHSASQPRPPWPPTPAGGEPPPSDVALGEVLLGHRDRHDEVADWARGSWLFENGTFLVVRKLQQDVAAFEGYLKRSASDLGVCPRRVSSWLLGRNPADGRTLVAPQAPDPGNAFDYSGPEAAFCPLHAHVRRANPRSAGTPRILRRSFPYGSPYGEATSAEERGLVFMAYNSSIAEQFEVIQRWLNGGNATGLPSIVNDAIAGVPQAAGAERWVPGDGNQKLAPPPRPFITLRWGLYLFVPSVPALQRLAGLAGEAGEAAGSFSVKAAAKRVKARPAGSTARKVKPWSGPLADPQPPVVRRDAGPFDDRGRRIIGEILGIESLERQRQAWKEVLEEPQRGRLVDAGAVWAAIRHPQLLEGLAGSFPRYAKAFRAAPAGTLPTPYGWLVSRYEHARAILADGGKRFSVEQYAVRLGETIEGHYLGLDGKDCRYAERALAANAYLSGLDAPGFYAAARKGADQALDGVARSGDPLETLDLRELALHAIGCVAQQYLFDPDPDSARPVAKRVAPFIPISRYCFQPYPDDSVKDQARLAGELLRDRAQTKVDGPFARFLRSQPGPYQDEDLVRSAVLGAMVGFAPPAVAHVVSILLAWLAAEELPRHARKGARERSAAVIGAMTRVPVPPTLYRTIGSGARLGARALPGETFGSRYVVIGTQSVTLDAREQAGAEGAADAWQWLFAGDRQDTSLAGGSSMPAPAVHGCPARHHAVAAISGVIDAVCEHYPAARLCGALALLPGPRSAPDTAPLPPRL